MRMSKHGILDGVQTCQDAEARLDVFWEEYCTEALWRSFREWISRNRSQADQLVVKNLKARATPEITMCTTDVVSRALNNLESLLKEVGIMASDGTLLPSETNRLFCCDEKGFSQRADNVSRNVVSKAQARTASVRGPDTSWEHISVCLFMPCSGERYPAGVVVSTARIHESFPKLFPCGIVRANKGGSVTSEIFNEFFMEAFAKVARERLGNDKPLVCILDSGGGSWLHLSPSLVRVAVAYGVRPFFLPAYTTRACMPLDQTAHACMAELWASLKQQLAQRSQSLSIYVALKSIAGIVDAGLTEKNAVASWSRCGFCAGERLNRDKLFIDRAAELFQSLRDAKHEDAQPAEGKPAARALSLLSTVSPAKSKCAECAGWLDTHMRYCPTCGKENTAFDSEKADLLRTGHRKGWKRALAVQYPDLPEEDGYLLNQVDDLLSVLRKRNRAGKAAAAGTPAAVADAAETPAATADVAEAATHATETAKHAAEDPAEQSAPSKKPKSSLSAPSTAAPSAMPKVAAEDLETSSDRDLDLNDPEDVVTYLLSHWSRSRLMA